MSSNPENPGIPDRLLCDDGWFETYGYILLVGGDVGLPSELVNGLPSDVDVVSVELCDEMCELMNGWNCGYFGSMLSNKNLDIAHINLVFCQCFLSRYNFQLYSNYRAYYHSRTNWEINIFFPLVWFLFNNLCLY